jgi:hypothetical protein
MKMPPVALRGELTADQPKPCAEKFHPHPSPTALMLWGAGLLLLAGEFGGSLFVDYLVNAAFPFCRNMRRRTRSLKRPARLYPCGARAKILYLPVKRPGMLAQGDLSPDARVSNPTACVPMILT